MRICWVANGGNASLLRRISTSSPRHGPQRGESGAGLSGQRPRKWRADKPCQRHAIARGAAIGQQGHSGLVPTVGGAASVPASMAGIGKEYVAANNSVGGAGGGRGGQRVRASDALSKCDAVGCHFTERSPLSSARSVLSRNNHGAQALSPLLACASSFNFGLLWARS